MRVRPRHNQHQTKLDQSVLPTHDTAKEMYNSNVSQFQEIPTKHLQTESLNSTEDEEKTLCVIRNMSHHPYSLHMDSEDKLNDDDNLADNKEEEKKKNSYRLFTSRKLRNIPTKKWVLSISCIMFFIFIVLPLTHSSTYKALDVQHRLEKFLNYWVGGLRNHPIEAICIYMCLYIIIVIFLIPGTPFTVAGGFIFSKSFGFIEAVLLITGVVLLSSTIGYVTAFYLGRYFLQEDVKRRMLQKYPLFVIMDKALSKNTFWIMSLLHLTPVIPFGPVSYMSGGLTSMQLSSFAIANVASIPLTVLYVFLGASAGKLLEKANEKEIIDITDELEVRKDDLHARLFVLGICMSIFSIAIISRVVRKEFDNIIQNEKGVSRVSLV